MNSDEAILQTIRGLMPELRRHYHVAALGLFGSRARNEANAESDIDLLVEFDKPIGLLSFLQLEEELTARLGSPVDLVSRKALKPRIGRNILRDVQMA